MELAELRGGSAIHQAATSPLGPPKVADIADPEKRDKYIRKDRQDAADRGRVAGGTLCSRRRFWRAIARFRHGADRLSAQVLHGYEPPLAQLVETLGWIREQEPGALAAMTGTSTARLSLVPLASLVLGELLRWVEPATVTISGYGLREGCSIGRCRGDAGARPADRCLPPDGFSAARAPASATRSMTGCCRSMPTVRPPSSAWCGPPACCTTSIGERIPTTAPSSASIGHAGQYRWDRPCRAGVSWPRAAQPLQDHRSGRRGRALCQLLPPSRAAEAVVLGRALRQGPCCRAPRSGCWTMPVCRSAPPASPSPCAARRANSPARRWSAVCKASRRASIAATRLRWSTRRVGAGPPWWGFGQKSGRKTACTRRPLSTPPKTLGRQWVSFDRRDRAKQPISPRSAHLADGQITSTAQKMQR